MSLKIGVIGHDQLEVAFGNTAVAIGSGLMPVFATPNMTALMEGAAVNALAPYLKEGESSVGIHLDISHDAGTPIGMTVSADAELIEINGRVLTFNVVAYDTAGTIGKGTHQRAIINVERFLEKVEKRKEGR